MANFDVAKAIFNQADRNRDGRIDREEFRSWASNAAGAGGNAGGFAASSYESGSFQSSAGGGIDASQIIAASGSGGFAGQSTTSGYEASYSSQSGVESAGGLATGGLDASYTVGGAGAGLSASASTNEIAQTSGTTLQASSSQEVTQYASSGGLFTDPNPQVVRRPATGGPVTYQQKILVRFLQPPPIPPPGPLIIKEVRPPQPPPPPPLVIRQRAPPLAQPPPLILRERPPAIPASVASQTVIRRLAALPVPPRSVIIERLPPLPPKPRDIIIERWIPYGAQAKRRTIVQRAAAAKDYPKPRNIIIQYEAPQVRIVRQFQRLGVTQENPQAYVARYGATLLDAATLLQQARAAGVVEDISPPTIAGQFSATASSTETAAISQQISSSTGTAGLEGLQVVGGGGSAQSSTFGLEATGDSAAAGGGSYSSESYSSSASFGAEGVASGGSTGFDFAAATFAAVDANRDGRIDQGEFQRFVQGGL